MSISAIVAAGSTVSAAPPQQQAALAPLQTAPKPTQNDGDQDDQAIKAAAPAPQPTVNLNGQTVGGTISVIA